MSDETVKTEVVKETPEETTVSESAVSETTEKKKKKRQRRSIYDVTRENDIWYRGPLSYRGLKIIGWLCIVFSQIVVIMGTRERILQTTEQVVFGDVINEMIISLGLPLLLISNFAILLQGRDRYKQLLIINGSIALGVSVLYLIVYQRYALGFISIFTGGKAQAAVRLDQILSYLPDYNGFFTFNIYFDLFLCTLFMFFIDYKPKKLFKGKALYVFRSFALIPVLYEVFCITLKILAMEKVVIIPMAMYPVLTTKPPLSFLLFVFIVVFIKGREKRYIKHGKTHEDYREFLRTNTNSFQFSRMLAILAVIFAGVDFLQAVILSVVYLFRQGVDFSAITQEQIVASLQWATTWGAGEMMSMIFIVPIILLFSYTRTYRDKFVDFAIPVVGIILIILVYIDGTFNIVGEVLRVGKQVADENPVAYSSSALIDSSALLEGTFPTV